jgi:hypothetical protein
MEPGTGGFLCPTATLIQPHLRPSWGSRAKVLDERPMRSIIAYDRLLSRKGIISGPKWCTAAVRCLEFQIMRMWNQAMQSWIGLINCSHDSGAYLVVVHRRLRNNQTGLREVKQKKDTSRIQPRPRRDDISYRRLAFVGQEEERAEKKERHALTTWI